MTISQLISTDHHTIQVIDSHSGGEPTRVVTCGGPDLGEGSVADKLKVFSARYDKFRSAIVNEPRGSDGMVGALLTEPAAKSCAAGVVFFNNVGYLGMCGHGLMGLIVTLAYRTRIRPGRHRVETPVGVVTAQLHESGEVSVQNVPSYRLARNVAVAVHGYGTVTGDIAWGGNWFYLVHDHGQELALARVEELTDFTWRIREALQAQGITGPDDALIDHVELFAPSALPGVHSKNFVLCPGKAYDRSPCGTGTSAKLACLYTDGKLAEGEIYRQESITGSVFEATIQRVGGDLIPTITGRAYVNGEATLILNPYDPLCWGVAS